MFQQPSHPSPWQWCLGTALQSFHLPPWVLPYGAEADWLVGVWSSLDRLAQSLFSLPRGSVGKGQDSDILYSTERTSGSGLGDATGGCCSFRSLSLPRRWAMEVRAGDIPFPKASWASCAHCATHQLPRNRSKGLGLRNSRKPSLGQGPSWCL